MGRGRHHLKAQAAPAQASSADAIPRMLKKSRSQFGNYDKVH